MIIWPNGSPSIPRVTSEFSPSRRNPVTGKVRPHNGIDLAGWSTIVCPVRGRVTRHAYQPDGAGNWIEVTEDTTGHRFRFFHLAAPAFRIVNDRVVPGDHLGVMGHTGSATGVHLHYEVHVDDAPQNPRTYYANRQKETAMDPAQLVDALVKFRVGGRNIWDSLKQLIDLGVSIDDKVGQLLKRPAGAVDVEALAKAIVVELGKK